MGKKITVFFLMAFMLVGSLAFQAQAAVEVTWEKMAPMPTARVELTTTVVNGKIYAIGGFDDEAISNTVEIYDINTNTWTTGSPIPEGLWHHTAQAVDDKIYVFGGSSKVATTSTKMYIYNTITDKWSVGANISFPITRNHQSTVFNKKIYAKANDYSKGDTQINIYNTQNNTWSLSSKMPVDDVFCVYMATIEDKVYMLRGNKGKNDVLQIYDTKSNTWEKKSDIGSVDAASLHGLGFFSFKDSIYIVGGRAGENLHNEIREYNTSTNTWSVLTTLSELRHSQGTTVVGNKVYMIGGGKSGGVISNDVDVMTIGPSTSKSALSVLLEVDEQIQLSVSNDLSENQNFTWTSEDDSIAAVDTNGMVTAISPGLTKIYARNDEGFEEYIHIRVVEKGEADELRLAVDLKVGQTAKLYLSEEPNINWTSLSPSVVSVDDKGKITGIAKGLAMVKAEIDDVEEFIYVRVR